MYSEYYRPAGLYRSRDGWIFGVCRGLADYFDVSVTVTRILTVIAFLLTGFWPVGALYILLALLMKAEPRWRYYDFEDDF